jgi:hypothetical protein
LITEFPRENARNVIRLPPILTPGIQEPAEMRVDPIPVAVLTPPEQMMGEAMQQAGNKGGPAALLPALDRILAKYPEYRQERHTHILPSVAGLPDLLRSQF